ncbi:hypothetical protein B0T16DRAFT_390642 [Cercophora newfieldiana]|uniref:Uncharacterized protein n=1 Tax=Cercophora newfieldiana TaxID=92897 RepID=A0AA39Y572_9PEZI|nr:hypothetical protein B0T16DRAFT_390642 [Cercophora newfieldiana]
MASFSRGLGPQFLLLVRQQGACKCASTPQPATHILFRLSRSPFQSQSHTRFLQACAKIPVKGATIRKTSPKNGAPLLPSAASTPLSSRIISYASQLALKNRVTLYEAPSHFWFRLSSMTAAFFCITYTTYHYWSIYLNPPPDLDWWVPHAYGVICVFMASIGVYFALGTSRIVRSIDAVSVASLLASNKGKLPKALARKAGSGAQSPIVIEVSTQRMVPFVPNKKILLWPDQVLLPFRMADAVAARSLNGAPKPPMSLKAQLEAARAEQEAKAAARKYNMEHIMTAPFRDAKKGFKAVWEGMARAFNREGFAKITLDNLNYKLDVSGGWAMDEGRAMDRILPIKQIKM